MSTSADHHTNGNGNTDHILRPRAVKLGNPMVLRAQEEEGLTVGNHKELAESASGQTR